MEMQPLASTARESKGKMIDKLEFVMIEVNGVFVSTDQAHNLWLATASSEVRKYSPPLRNRD